MYMCIYICIYIYIYSFPIHLRNQKHETNWDAEALRISTSQLIPQSAFRHTCYASVTGVHVRESPPY